jgi:hypothetical protein
MKLHHENINVYYTENTSKKFSQITIPSSLRIWNNMQPHNRQTLNSFNQHLKDFYKGT